MNFQYDCENILGCDGEGIAILEPAHKNFSKLYNYIKCCEIVDAIGNFSAMQRGLKSAITSSELFFTTETSSNDKIFIKAKGNCVIGFLRIGKRKLFIHDSEGDLVESEVLCLFDFYVYHTVQRLGHGKSLFDKVLRFYNLPAYKVGYDCANVKILNFLYKHYSLKNYSKQFNNLIIFNDFFTGRNNDKQMNYNYALKHQFYNKQPIIENRSNIKYILILFSNDNQLREAFCKNFFSSTPQQKSAKPNGNIYTGNSILNQGIYFESNSSNPTLNMLNSSVDKRFHNYFLNHNNRIDINYSKEIDKLSKKENKFDDEAYLKNLIKEKAQDIMSREQRMKELETQIYRNYSPNAYYMKKNDYATIRNNIFK